MTDGQRCRDWFSKRKKKRLAPILETPFFGAGVFGALTRCEERTAAVVGNFRALVPSALSVQSGEQNRVSEEVVSDAPTHDDGACVHNTSVLHSYTYIVRALVRILRTYMCVFSAESKHRTRRLSRVPGRGAGTGCN